MAADPKRGATAPPRSGAYKTPDSDGVRDKNESNPYRPPRDGIKDITEINYVPYGGVYEREGLHPYDRVSTGGAYENPTPEVPELPLVFISSLTYPPVNSDSISAEGIITGGSMLQPTSDLIEAESLITGGTLVPILQSYNNWPPDLIESDGLLTGGTLDTALLSYYWPAEEIKSDGLLTGGTLVVALLTYSNALPDQMVASGLITGGTLA